MGLLDQLQAYIKANTPRSTRPVAKPADVIDAGLLNPNKYNAPAANRFKDSAFGLLGIVPGVGDAASAAESADLFNRGENFAGSLAALGALPLVPAIGGMLKQGGRAADALSYVDEAAQKARQLTKYELAHQAAQKNAVDMLGLPPGNTAMDRAAAMGFDTPAYHGTANDVPEFKNSELGKTTRADSAKSHHFFAENPWSSNAYTWTNLYEGVPEKYVIHTDLGRMLKKTTPKEYRDLIDSRYDLMEQARKTEKGRVVGLFESKEPLKTKKWTDGRGFNFSQTDFNEQGLRDFAQEYGLPYKGEGPVKFTRSIAGPISTFSDTEHMYHLRDELASQAGASAAAVALGKSPNIMPVMLNTGKTKETSGALMRGDNGESLLTNILRRNKNYDTIKLTDITDGGPTTTHYAIKDPTRIRSKFAAFDPARRDSADLLAGFAPYAVPALGAGLLGTALMPDEAIADDKKKTKKKQQ